MTIKGKIKNSIENGYDIMNRFENDVKHIKTFTATARTKFSPKKSKKPPFAEISTYFKIESVLQAFSRGLKAPQ